MRQRQYRHYLVEKLTARLSGVKSELAYSAEGMLVRKVMELLPPFLNWLAIVKGSQGLLSRKCQIMINMLLVTTKGC